MNKLLVLSISIFLSGCTTIPSNYTFSGGTQPIVIEIHVTGLEDLSKTIGDLSRKIR